MEGDFSFRFWGLWGLRGFQRVLGVEPASGVRFEWLRGFRDLGFRGLGLYSSRL